MEKICKILVSEYKYEFRKFTEIFEGYCYFSLN